jgi:hypothetical protein
MDGATWAKYLDLQLFSQLNLEDKIHIQGGWNVTTWGRSEGVTSDDMDSTKKAATAMDPEEIHARLE